MAASGLTYLQIINRVLERLRESSVAAYNSTDYSTFIAGLVNQVKSEIEDAWHWHALRDTFSVTCEDGVVHYALADTGMNAVILEGWNVTQGRSLLTRGSGKDFNLKFFGIGGNALDTGSPLQFIQNGLDDNYDIALDVWPVPTTGHLDTLKFNVYVPQADLAADATVPLVPQNVLIEETIARAFAERGEEGAPQTQPGMGSFIRSDLLAQAVMRDQGADPTETDWEVE